LAMGRQTIWGGLGKPPGRDVMAAAAKAARTDMLNRVRENRAGNGERSSAAPGRGPAGGRGGNGGGARGGRPSQPGQGFAGADNGGRSPAQRPAQAGRGRPFGGGGGGFGGGNPANTGNGGGNGGGDDFQPRNIRHDAGRNVTGFSANNQGTPGQRGNAGGQPDPLRTSVDSMAGSGRRGGGGGFGGNRGGNRSGGGGFAPRGPGGNPPRSFGR
jgi:ATP-dependent RNA helicase RhlE